MSLSSNDHIQSFLAYLKYQKRYSPHTLLSYEVDLSQFFAFVGHQYGNISIQEISPALTRTWLASLKQNDMAARSINRKISTLKAFFKFHLKNNTISASPVSAVVSLKLKKRLPSFVEQKDLTTLFRQIEFPDTWKGKTDQLLLKVFYQTGIRLSELINLKESQVDAANKNVKVIGKGNKERVIPVSNQLIMDIALYLEDKKNVSGNVIAPFIFINHKGNKLYPKYVYNVVKHYLGEVTTNDRKSPHVLRHSFATHLTSNGADINAVKELLGHTSLAATQVYLHNSITRLKEIHKKTHPKA